MFGTIDVSYLTTPVDNADQAVSFAEQWRSVIDYEGLYEVSDHGRVRSLDHVDRFGRKYKGKVRSPGCGPGGGFFIGLYKEGKVKYFKIPRLVLEAFIGRCPPGQECCHWDDNPANNYLSNLRWDTRSSNRYDSVRNGTHQMANKKKCLRGHDFSVENTYIHPDGRRQCRICRREHQRKWEKVNR